MKKVTCWYCEYYGILFKFENLDFIDAGFGRCSFKNKCINKDTDICERFELRKGLYTLKWYPGKTGKW